LQGNRFGVSHLGSDRLSRNLAGKGSVSARRAETSSLVSAASYLRSTPTTSSNAPPCPTRRGTCQVK